MICSSDLPGCPVFYLANLITLFRDQPVRRGSVAPRPYYSKLFVKQILPPAACTENNICNFLRTRYCLKVEVYDFEGKQFSLLEEE